jgi:ATP:corrinoid adenosyltransferase
MSITDILKVGEIKAERDRAIRELAFLKQSLAGSEKMQLHELKLAIADLEQNKQDWGKAIHQLAAGYKQKEQELQKQLQDLNNQINERKKDVIILDEEILLQSFGFYKLRYGLENSEMYKAKLEEIRARQAELVKSGKAASSSTNWTVNNSQSQGQKMIKDYVKLILRSFNNECDASIVNVKFNNVDSIEKKIRKAFEVLNKLGQQMSTFELSEVITARS